MPTRAWSGAKPTALKRSTRPKRPSRSNQRTARDVDWRLRQWGAGHSQAFVPQPLDLKAGDSIRFTRNDREAGRINGGRGEVIAVDEQARTATIRTARGTDRDAEPRCVARDRHIAHAYVETAFAAQGRTADHVIIHADSRAANLVDQKILLCGDFACEGVRDDIHQRSGQADLRHQRTRGAGADRTWCQPECDDGSEHRGQQKIGCRVVMTGCDVRPLNGDPVTPPALWPSREKPDRPSAGQSVRSTYS